MEIVTLSSKIKTKNQIYLVYKEHSEKWKRNIANSGADKEMSGDPKQKESKNNNINVTWARDLRLEAPNEIKRNTLK